MKAIVVIINLVALVMTIIPLIFFIRGIIILFKGKLTLRKNMVKGSEAKTIGWSFVIVPILLFGLWALLFENLDLGSSSNKNAFLVSPIVQSLVFIIGIGVLYFWALSKAKKFQRKLNQQSKKKDEMKKN